jgi:cell division protein FtsB
MKLRWAVAAVAGLALYFVVFGGEYSWLELRRLEREQRAETEALERAQAEVKLLRAHADSLARDPIALERIARERFGLVREGERLYRFAPEAPRSAAPTSPPSNPVPKP